MPDQSKKHARDLFVPAETIQRFHESDLGFADLPVTREELVALSMRMDVVFTHACKADLELLEKEKDEIPREVALILMTDIAHDFVDRYGVLAFFSADFLRVLWENQRPKCAAGPKRLREIGERVAVFALAAKSSRPKKAVGLSFKVNKPYFLAELDRLARQMGNLDSEGARADQLIEIVRAGEYPMLKRNMAYLEEFLRCPAPNAYLNGKNAISAELLAAYGLGKELGEKQSRSMTPDQFFYMWMGWVMNKAPSTVRREVQTAAARRRARLNKLMQRYEKSPI